MLSSKVRFRYVGNMMEGMNVVKDVNVSIVTMINYFLGIRLA
jgi:hypothetical protein